GGGGRGGRPGVCNVPSRSVRTIRGGPGRGGGPPSRRAALGRSRVCEAIGRRARAALGTPIESVEAVSQSPRRIAFVTALGLGAVAVVALAAYSTVELRRFERAEARRSVVVYPAGQTLSRGVGLAAVAPAGPPSRLGH